MFLNGELGLRNKESWVPWYVNYGSRVRLHHLVLQPPMGLMHQLMWGIITDEHGALMERWLVSENLNTQFCMQCPTIEVGIVMLRNFDHYILINEVSIVR